MALALGFSGSIIDDPRLKATFEQHLDEDFNQQGSNFYTTLLTRLVNFETVAGLIAGAGVGLFVGGGGIVVIALALLGGFVGFILNYYSIIQLMASTLPAPIQWLVMGVFGIMFIVMLMRYAAGR